MRMVLKFGGSSLADPVRIRRAAERICDAYRQGNQVVAVVSAQGDVTDALIEKVRQASLGGSAREMDAYLAAGEQMSAALVAMAVSGMGVPAISLTGWQAGIRTDGNHGSARIQALENDRILRELDAGRVAVVAGFQGVTQAGDVTTLGRGGSDTTAVALAALLPAERCLIYTDVDGVYDKDPRKDPTAAKYPYISYEKMLDLARNGAQVLHDRSVELAMRYGVRIRVLSSFRPGPGTVVGPAESFSPHLP